MSDDLFRIAPYEEVYGEPAEAAPPPPPPPRSRRLENQPEPAPSRLTYRMANDVKVERPVWLWPCWLVAAAVQLLVGRQGSGKSTFIAWVVAQLSTGRPWPSEAQRRPPLRCAMLSLEEPAERLVARLQAAGADLGMVAVLGDVEDHDEEGRPFRRRWQLPGDCQQLEAAIVELGVAVVTIDGLGYAVHGDSHNYANVGSALSALAGVAERTGACVLGLTHPPKGNADATTAAIGSTAWTAVARITWVMGFDPTDEPKARRVVRPAPGSNYRLPDHGLSFIVGNDEETEAGFVTGLGDSQVSAEAITAPPEPDSPEELSKLDEARDFVRRAIAEGPCRPPPPSRRRRRAASRSAPFSGPGPGKLSSASSGGPSGHLTGGGNRPSPHLARGAMGKSLAGWGAPCSTSAFPLAKTARLSHPAMARWEGRWRSRASWNAGMATTRPRRATSDRRA